MGTTAMNSLQSWIYPWRELALGNCMTFALDQNVCISTHRTVMNGLNMFIFYEKSYSSML